MKEHIENYILRQWLTARGHWILALTLLILKLFLILCPIIYKASSLREKEKKLISRYLT